MRFCGGGGGGADFNAASFVWRGCPSSCSWLYTGAEEAREVEAKMLATA